MKASSHQQSAKFSLTRRAHQNELGEDYVEIILELTESKGNAHLVEIAKELGVAHPTASKTLKKLKREGLVSILPYRSITLTKKGQTLALSCRKRHEIVLQFLLALGVDRDTAENDSEGIEHHVSPKTLRLMEKFITKK